MTFKFAPALQPKTPFKTLPPSVWAFIWEAIRPQWKLTATAYSLFALAFMIGASYPYFIGKFIDALSTTGVESIAQTWWWLVLPFIARAVIERFGAFFLFQKVVTPIESRLIAMPYQHLLFQDMAYSREQASGALASKIKAIYTAFKSLREAFLWQILHLVIGFVIGFFILLTVPVPFLLLLIGWSLLACILGGLAATRIAHVTSVRAELDAAGSGIIVDGLTNNYTVKAQAYEAAEYDHYRGKLEEYSQQTVKYHKVWFDLHSSQEISYQLMIVTLGGLIVWLWPQGVLTVGQVAMLIPLFLELVNRVWGMVSSITSIIDNYATIKTNLNTIYQPYKITDLLNAKPLIAGKGQVEFKAVSFQYNDKQHALFKGLDLKVKPGQRIGLVGHSGAGKSTLMSLLLRFYDVQKGRIEIDGQNITKVTQQSLRRSMVMVPQDTALFNRSIMDNIRYGRPEATEEEVIEAAKKAHAHTFIERLPKGYASRVGERGVKLSGGQRQRIAIARAFLSAPKIVLLDEATSALDSESEVAIQKSLTTLMKGRTVIAIAHRLSTLRQMDRIVVMDEGRVVEDGTHAQLLKKKNGIYARLWHLQKGGFLPEDVD